MRMKSFVAVLLTLTMVFSVPGGVLAAAPQDTEPAAETTVEKEAQAEQASDAQAKDEQKAKDSQAKEPSDQKDAKDKEESESVSLKNKTLDVNRDNYEITVSGMMPEDAELDVKEIGSSTDEYKEYIKDASKEVFKDSEEKKDDTLPYARFFDIKIKYADGEEFQPDNDLTLKIDTKDDTLKDKDLDFSAVHFVEDKGDADKYDTQLVKMEIEDKEDNNKGKKKDEEKIASMKADSFSVYGVVYTYTVDFYYENAEHHMNGGSEMKLSELFGKLGIDKDVKDVEKVEFTDDSLVIPTKDGDDYNIKSLKPFRTSEMLTVTFKDGNVINILTKDAISGTVGSNVAWELSDDGKLVIKPGSGGDTGTLPNVTNVGNPPSDSLLTQNWPWYAYKDQITSVVVEEGVKTNKEARGMFAKLPNLTTAALSGLDASALGIANDMFRGSSALETLILPGSFAPKQAWRMCMDCSALTEVTIGSADKPFNPGETMAYRQEEGLGYMPSFQQFDVDGSGSYSGREAFRGCTSLTTLNMPGTVLEDINGTNLNTRYVQNLFKSFDRANSEPKTINMENSQLAGGNKDSALRHMFKLDTLENLNLSGSTIEENNLRVLFHNVDNNTNITDYNACQMLRDVDMTNVTFLPASNNDTGYGTVSALNMFKGLKGLETVDMSGAVFPDGIIEDPAGSSYKACTNFQQMFDDCTNLKRVTMANTAEQDMNVKGATNMQNVFRGCSSLEYLDISGFGELPNITNMNGFLGADGNNCTALETLIIDNLNNSAIQPRRGSDHEHASDGRMLFTYGDPSSNLPNLKTVSAKNSKVWFVKDNNAGNPGSELYLAAFESDIYYLTKKVTTFKPDENTEVTETIDSKRDWIDLIKDRYGQSSGASSIPDASKNINNKDGRLNTNGAGFLAPGVYEIGDSNWKEPKIALENTYYRISNINGSVPEIDVTDDLNRIIEDDGSVTTDVFTKDEWNDSTKFDVVGNDRTIKNADNSPIITITYPKAAEDIYGGKHDVIVKIKAITFKNIDRIKENENVRHDPNKYISDAYARDILSAKTGELNFRNYVLNSSGERAISGGSGTYIDFNVEVKDAIPNTSVLFYMEDLDVPALQNYRPGIDPADEKRDWHFGDLPFKLDGEGYGNTWGSGSEGMILGAGNDLTTLKFADHTGLELINGKEIVSTGGDPNTAWSSFSVRAASTGANYTWTSGVPCDTYLLKQTDPPEKAKPVYVMPEALKNVSGSAPEGIYFTEYFRFDMSDAWDDVPEVEIQGDHKGMSNSEAPAPSLGTSRSNEGEYIYYGHMQFETPNTQPYKAAYVYKIKEKEGSTGGDVIKYDTEVTYYMQIIVQGPDSDENLSKGTKALVYIGEKRGTDTKIYWDTEHYLTLWAQDMQPVYKTIEYAGETYDVYTDGENEYIIKKADADTETYWWADDPSVPLGYAPVVRNKVQKTTKVGVDYPIYEDKNGDKFYRKDGKCYDPATDDEVARDIDSMVDTGTTKEIEGTFSIYKDANGKEFYRKDGSFWKADDNTEQAVTTQVDDESKDKTVEYTIGGVTKTYTVKKDHNGVEYFKADNGYYYTPVGKQLIQTVVGDINPKSSDETATKKKEVEVSGSRYGVKKDIHGVEYIKIGSKYYNPAATSTEITVKDGQFNPSSNDESVYENKTKDGYVIKRDVDGKEYYVKNGNYYNPDDDTTELTARQEGEVDPSVFDKVVKEKLVVGVPMKESRTGNGYVIKKTKGDNPIFYYQVGEGQDATYFSVIGLSLDPDSSDFHPEEDDDVITTTVDIMNDEGTGQQYYRIDGKYYTYAPGDDSDGSKYTLGENTVDTSDIAQVGTFNNVIKTSEIVIEKETVGNKSGTFTFNVKFDNDFEPRNLSYSPSEDDSPVATKADGWSKTNNVWEITLHEGQKVAIRDVPFQTTYTITEPVTDNGWELVSVDGSTTAKSVTGKLTEERYTRDDQGKLTDEENDAWKDKHIHTFENRLTEVVVDKKVVNETDSTTAFSFTAEVTLANPTVGDEFSIGWLQEEEAREFKIAKVVDKEGTTGYENNTFEFTLKNGEDIALIMPEGATVKVTEKSDTASKQYYTEVAKDNADPQKGMTISAANVKDSDSTKLHFVNYKVDPVTHSNIEAEKIIDGRSWRDSDTFDIRLTADHANNPMPDGKVKENDSFHKDIHITNEDTETDDGYKKGFGSITYSYGDMVDHEGKPVTEKTFTYHVRESIPEVTGDNRIPGISYTTARYEVDVKVALSDDKKALEVKEYKVYSTKPNGDRDAEVTDKIASFTNKYNVGETDRVLTGQKELTNTTGDTDKDLKNGQFTFVLKPIGDNAAKAPMPVDSEGTGANRVKKITNVGNTVRFTNKTGTDPESQKGIVFNYDQLLDAGFDDEEMHSDTGVILNYEMYEEIPDAPAGGKKVNNNDGTVSIIDADGNVTVYDGIHHTRTIAVKVIADSVTGEPVLFINSIADFDTGDFFIDKDGNKKDVSTIIEEGYVSKEHHAEGGAPLFHNFYYKQKTANIKIVKKWEDAGDQDKIRPESVTVNLTSDAGDPMDEEIELTKDSNGDYKAEVKDLPVYSHKHTDGQSTMEKIKYTLTETEVPEGYTASYDPGKTFTLDPDATKDLTITVTNTHTPTPGKITGDETWGLPGVMQVGKPNYKVVPTNPVSHARLVDPETGNQVEELTIDGEGTYKILSNGDIEFTPEDGFIGDGTELTVTGKDLQNNEVTATYRAHVVDPNQKQDVTRTVHFVYESKDGEKVTDDVVQTVTLSRTVTAVNPKTGEITGWTSWSSDTFPAVPNPDDKVDEGWITEDKIDELEVKSPDKVDDEYVIYHKGPEPGEKTTYGGKGETQKGTPEFKEGSSKLTTYKLIDPKTGNPVNEVKVPKEGTYTINTKTGEVTFVPEDGFEGKATTVKVRGTDENGLYADGEYTPIVVDNTQTESKTQKITYVYENGSPVLDNAGKPIVKERKATFTRTGKVDPETGAITGWNSWTEQTLPKVDSPEIKDYTPDKKTIPPTAATPDKWPKDETVTYKPVPKEGPKAGYKITYGGKGDTQKGTPKFEAGSTPITGYQLIDPTTGNPTKEVKVQGQGTYTIDTKTGEVTFVPEDSFVGTATTVKVRGTDENGLYADGEYTPIVVDNTETVTKTQKITYVYDSGNPVVDDDNNPVVKERKATFTRTGKVDPDTGKITWDSWTEQTLPKENSPKISGFKPDKDSIAATKATPDNWPKDEKVTYKALGPAWIEGSTVKSKDTVGRIQYGTLTFKPGASPIAYVKFIDPATGEETDAKSVDVYDKNGKKIGTYSLNSTGKKRADGSIAYEIKFTPVAGYTGKPPAITLRAYDENMLYADGVYQPNVIGKEAKKSRKQTISKTSVTSTKTGDEMPITLWLVLMSVSGAAVIAGIFRRRKEH